MNWKMGFFSDPFCDYFPRGLRRAARAIVESLSRFDQDLELFCITKKITNSRPVSFINHPLADWLKNNPLRKPLATFNDGQPSWLKEFLKSLIPPVLVPPLKWAFHRFKNYGSNFQLPGDYSNPGPKTTITLDELDSFVTFDPFDPVWELPLEYCPCLKSCWFYDAIPKRINEGEKWGPENFDLVCSRVAMRADHIFCDSQSAEADLCHFYPAAKGKTSVIHLGHDVERFSQPFLPNQLQKLQLRLGIQTDLPYFLFVGTVEPRKNVAGILHAARHLKKTRPDKQFQLVLAGQIHGQPELRELITQTQAILPLVAPNYLPDQDITTLFQGAAGFIYPSFWEGFGIPNLEAMTAGTLVVTSDVGPMPEVCGPHALYCDPYDHREIAAQMLRCLEMPNNEKVSRIAAARAHASQFTWKRAAEKMVNTLQQLLETRAGNKSGET